MLRGPKPPGLVGWGFVWGCRLPFSPVFTHLSSFSLDRRGTKTSWLSAWGRRWFGPRSLGQWMFWPHWGPAELLTPWTPPQVAAVLSWELWKLSVLFLQELIQSDKLWGCCSMLVPSLHDFYYLIRVGDGPPFLLQPVDGCIPLAVLYAWEGLWYHHPCSVLVEIPCRNWWSSVGRLWLWPPEHLANPFLISRLFSKAAVAWSKRVERGFWITAG